MPTDIRICGQRPETPVVTENPSEAPAAKVSPPSGRPNLTTERCPQEPPDSSQFQSLMLTAPLNSSDTFDLGACIAMMGRLEIILKHANRELAVSQRDLEQEAYKQEQRDIINQGIASCVAGLFGSLSQIGGGVMGMRGAMAMRRAYTTENPEIPSSMRMTVENATAQVETAKLRTTECDAAHMRAEEAVVAARQELERTKKASVPQQSPSSDPPAASAAAASTSAAPASENEAQIATARAKLQQAEEDARQAEAQWDMARQMQTAAESQLANQKLQAAGVLSQVEYHRTTAVAQMTQAMGTLANAAGEAASKAEQGQATRDEARAKEIGYRVQDDYQYLQDADQRFQSIINMLKDIRDSEYQANIKIWQ